MAWLFRNKAYEWTLPTLPMRDLSGQTILITGCNTGLGLDMAQKMAERSPAKLIVTGRSLQKMTEPLSIIKRAASNPNVKVIAMELDLLKSASIKSFAARLVAENSRLDLVVYNAAVAGLATFDFSEGHELTMQTNVYGTTHLFLLLYPLLQRTTPLRGTGNTARAILVSSTVYSWVKGFPTTDGEELLRLLDSKEASIDAEKDSNKRALTLPPRYPVSKMCLMAIFINLCKHLKAEDVAVCAVSPTFARSNLSRHLHNYAFHLAKRVFGTSLDAGSRAILYPAFLDDAASTHGVFFDITATPPLRGFLATEKGAKAGTGIYRGVLSKLAKEDPEVAGQVQTLLAATG